MRNTKGISTIELVVVCTISLISIVCSTILFNKANVSNVSVREDLQDTTVRKSLTRELFYDIHSALDVDVSSDNKEMIVYLTGNNECVYQIKEGGFYKNNEYYCFASEDSLFSLEGSEVCLELVGRKGYTTYYRYYLQH